MLKTNLFIQSDKMLPSIGTILKELGFSGYSEDVYDSIDQIYYKRWYLVEIGIRKFLDHSGLQDVEVRNNDVVIYFSDGIPSGNGTY